MKYTKNIMRVLFAAILCAVGTSCNDWLNVQPTDRVLEKQVYSSELKINEALNGLYLNMANTSVYGKNLTFYTTELLAQRYYQYLSMTGLNSNKERPELNKHDYTQSETRTHLNNIFSRGYTIIMNINLFIERLTATEGIVSESRKSLMLGEAYALRAFMHFDLLRLYGPVPSVNPEGASIPYYTKADVKWQEIESHSEIIEKVLGDIETALVLLENDPILTKGVITGDDSDEYASDFFYTQYRNRRMNYYAVEALKARALMYKGGEEDVQEAALIAKTLILTDQFNESFPWTTGEEVQKARQGDKIFSNEVIFGIHASKLYEQWDAWFSPGKSSYSEILGVHEANVNYMYGTTSDYRAGFWTNFPRAENYILTTKYQKTEEETDFWYFQPLIRKTELYLIAAEVYDDVSYVDDIRAHRNMLPLEGSFTLSDEICKEYMKEFIGEGQLWFYYKRLNKPEIRSHDGGTVTVSPSQYVVPKPTRELEDRETN